MSSKKHIINGTLAAIIAAAVLAAGAMAGCGGKNESKSATPDTVVETQVVTEIVDGVYVDENGNAITDPSGNPIKATEATTKAKEDSKTSKSDSKQQSSSSGSASSKTDSKQQSSSSKAASDKSQSSKSEQSSAASQSSGSSKTDSGSRKQTPSGASDTKTKQETKKDDSAKDLKIAGKSYKVGDKVTCTYYLTVPNQMLNFQGRVQYDTSMLKKTNAYLVAPASYNSLVNPKLDGRVVFNGSDLSGYDFKSPGYEFLVVEYEALKTGTTEPSITFEVLTDTNDKAYAGSDGALTNGAKVSEVYS